ncbi:UDP-N-acetyl-D-mannosamine dehydrogenase [Amylibacter sp.]|nr:UDP-N-acetyl-D-mannosamine dehydrogenase [Amylibacter sp.]
MPFKRVTILGLGYIGLPTAAILASKGIKVTGVDVNQKVVDTVNSGKAHIIEPGLEELIKTSINSGHLKASSYVQPADVFIIAVPTPLSLGKEPDVTYIKKAAKMIAPVLTKGNVIILESTSPVGTTLQLSDWLATERYDLNFPNAETTETDIHIAYCPERVIPGNVIEELESNTRIIGGLTKKCSEKASQLYKSFVNSSMHLTDSSVAEFVKLAENSYRDVNIAFANELSLICDKLKINVWELISFANKHPRVNILSPGPGVGGHCIAVDPWFIVHSVPEFSKLIKTARNINDSKPGWVIDKVKSQLTTILSHNPGLSLNQINISCLGLSFKADIDDLRESPALQIVMQMANELPCKLHVYEPNITSLPNILSEKCILTDLECAINLADVIVVLVDHEEVRNFNYKMITNKMIVDTRGCWQKIANGTDD